MAELDDPRITTFGLLLEAHARLVRHLDADLRRSHDLPLQSFEVVLRLGRTPGGCLTAGELGNVVALTSGGATRLIDRLETAGLVERRRNTADRRQVLVCLTDAGRRRLADALPGHLDGLQRYLGDTLPPGELSALAESLRALRDQFVIEPAPASGA